MSDETSATIREGRKDWMTEHREMYLRSGGTQGHIMNLAPVGGHSFTTHCLIKYTGRKTGRVFITPLIYGDIGGEVVIVASKGGADEHPAWYLNIRDSATIDVQIGPQAFRMAWREPVGEERARVWAFMVEVFPSYARYQASTSRDIPLVMFRPLAEIPVFREDEATGVRQL